MLLSYVLYAGSVLLGLSIGFQVDDPSMSPEEGRLRSLWLHNASTYEDTHNSGNGQNSIGSCPNARTEYLNAPQLTSASNGASLGKLVFAHYMVGNVYPEHVHKDVDDAVAMGLDGFALNIGDPTQTFVRDLLNNMFQYSQQRYPRFKLFFSLDVWASGSALKGVYPRNDYDPLLQDFLGHPAYLRYGPNNLPFLSTFSDGGLENFQWKRVLANYSTPIYFVPDFDGTLGYYTADPGWWAYWGDVINGLFSWESAWIKRDGKGGEYVGDVSADHTVMSGTSQHGKTYMMPLSALQYKNSYDTNIYRGGDLNFPTRMTWILTMNPSPHFVQIITWNDGPESHYIGNLWVEQNNDTQPGKYATQVDAPHTGWQPIFASFIRAFKAGLDASGMTPSGSAIEGALWYRTILKSVKCPNEAYDFYSSKPDGYYRDDDVLNWAVVVPPPQAGYQVRIISNGQVVHNEVLHQGLNYGSAGGVQAGFQRMEVLDSSGRKVSAAAGGRCISSECPDCIYNMNPQVVPLGIDKGDTGACPKMECKIGTPRNSYGGGARQVVVGYWAGRSLTTRSCAKRSIEDIPLDSISHLNLASAYISSNFNIYPMPGIGEEELGQITNLKQKAPGLKIWISLGGPAFGSTESDTKGIWTAVAGNAESRQSFVQNLLRFMKQWGFDGVDLNWQYPSAVERGGSNADTDSYLSLVKLMRLLLKDSDNNYGMSITAPTSQRYLRGFNIGEMHPFVDWINLMPFDLNGDLNSDYDHNDKSARGHTNISDIDSALNVLWRSSVPSNKVNLGISFAGRTYTLADPSCSYPGCAASGVGRAGQCTGQGGLLSYAEIEAIRKTYELTSRRDVQAATKWMTWDNDQWLSYDDGETLGVKAKFAARQGLQGFAVWSLDMDDRDHSALQALSGGVLGAFGSQNSIKDDADLIKGDLKSFAGFDCSWSACGAACGPGTVSAGAEEYCMYSSGNQVKKTLCCALKKAPKPEMCHWTRGSTSFTCGGACEDNESSLVSSTQPYVEGNLMNCYQGTAQYCCKRPDKAALDDAFNRVCEWTKGKCFKLDGAGKPKGNNVCGGRKFVTSRAAGCDVEKSEVLCCDQSVDTDSCYWDEGNLPSPKRSFQDCWGTPTCTRPGQYQVITDTRGGWDDGTKQQHMCFHLLGAFGTLPGASPVTGTGGFSTQGGMLVHKLSYCCDQKALLGDIDTSYFAVPMENLFPGDVSKSNAVKYDVQIDGGVGDRKDRKGPNDSGFGFYIMTGPRNELTTLHKRDGSHWDLVGCENTDDETQQTVKAVCTNDTEHGNCGEIFEGGVHLKVLEMPAGCGPGKYAVAESMEHSEDHSHLQSYLSKRGLADARVYDLTFHYNFSKITERGGSNVRIRIDYSDDPGYWQQIVADEPDKRKAKLRKREVEDDFGGDHRAWLEATWHLEKRAMHSDDLHKRWWSGNIRLWFDRMKDVDVKYTGVRHRVQNTHTVKIIDQDFVCPGTWTGKFDEMYVRAWADLSYDITTAAGITMIGNLADLTSFQQSHVWFRTSGAVDASLNFDARASMSFHSGPVNALNLPVFGATFRVPGIVTIGPNFRVVADVSGSATLALTASYRVKFASWDYSMRYPAPDVSLQQPQQESQKEVEQQAQVAPQKPPYQWDLSASGQVQATIKPVVEFGIKFDSAHLSDALLSLGVKASARMWGDANEIGQSSFRYCYGSDARAELFGSVDAPKLFNVDLSRYWTLAGRDFTIIDKTCNY